jgi:hypothetical protein
MFTWLVIPKTRHTAYVADYLPEISRDLETLIELGCDKDPEKRWSTEEFLGHLVEGSARAIVRCSPPR